MSANTSIEWADSTVNESMGCSGCELWQPHKGIRKCYAGAMTERYKGRPGYPEAFHKVTNFDGRMQQACGWSDLTGKVRPDKPWLDSRPRVIFVDDMGDVLDPARSVGEVRRRVIEPIASPEGSRHYWLILTKRAKRLVELENELKRAGMKWPENLGVGVSITNQGTLARAHYLKQIKPALRFWSLEPIWGQIEVPRELVPDWAIVGGESGPGAAETRMLDLRAVAMQLLRWRVTLFVKQLGSCPVGLDGKPLRLRDSKGRDWDEWPEWCSGLKVRALPEKIRTPQQLTLAVGME